MLILRSDDAGIDFRSQFNEAHKNRSLARHISRSAAISSHLRRRQQRPSKWKRRSAFNACAPLVWQQKKTSSVWRSRENLTTIFMYVFFLLISIKHFTGREKNQRTSMYYVCFCVDLAMLVDDANLKYKLNNLQLVWFFIDFLCVHVVFQLKLAL